jgi:hypothetical protein
VRDRPSNAEPRVHFHRTSLWVFSLGNLALGNLALWDFALWDFAPSTATIGQTSASCRTGRSFSCHLNQFEPIADSAP